MASAAAQPIGAPPPKVLSASAAYAVPVEKIEIDGKLDDWPKNAPRYGIHTYYPVYGPSDLDFANLADNADCSAWFSVAYSPTEQLIYVAIRVRDEKHVVGKGYNKTDAVEVYVQGVRKLIGDPVLRSAMAALQYSVVAGEGSYNNDGNNPGLLWGDPKRTKTKAAWHRDEAAGVTTYEIAVEPYDKFPDTPTPLVAGNRVGFDVAVVDKDDAADEPTMIYWGPIGAEKYFDPALLGELVLLNSADDLCDVSMKIERKGAGGAFAGLDIEVWKGEVPAGVFRTTPAGTLEAKLPAGEYTLKPARFAGAAPRQSFACTVKAGAGASGKLEIAPLKIPAVVEQSIRAYRDLLAYRDDTRVRIVGETSDGGDVRHEIDLTFAYAKPNRLSIASESPLLRKLRMASDGKLLGATADGASLPAPMDFKGTITPLLLAKATAGLTSQGHGLIPMPTVLNQSARGSLPSGGLAGGLIAHRVILGGDPERDLLRYTDRLDEVGDAVVDGEPVKILGITRPAAHVFPGFPWMGMRRGVPVDINLAFSKRDGLIRAMSFKFDMVSCLNPMFYRGREMPPQLVTWTARHNKVLASFAGTPADPAKNPMPADFEKVFTLPEPAPPPGEK